jgi:maltose O-acetyltransferase
MLIIPFLKKSGKDLRVDKTCFLSGLYNIELGNNIFLNRGCILQGGGGISVGDNTLFAPYVQIYSEEHYKQDYSLTISERVTIGANCWLCANVIVLKGANIPDNTIVPAGAIVTRKGII